MKTLLTTIILMIALIANAQSKNDNYLAEFNWNINKDVLRQKMLERKNVKFIGEDILENGGEYLMYANGILLNQKVNSWQYNFNSDEKLMLVVIKYSSNVDKLILVYEDIKNKLISYYGKKYDQVDGSGKAAGISWIIKPKTKNNDSYAVNLRINQKDEIELGLIAIDKMAEYGKKTEISKSVIGINWVLVEGSPQGDFYISATEVTFDQYRRFCKSTGYKNPDDYMPTDINPFKFCYGNQPVMCVNLADAQAFCKWLSNKTQTTIRLPEEDEWEYAARGGNKSKGYDYSGSNNIDDVAWHNCEYTHEVGTKTPNELGIYDMSGNVWEWCGSTGAIRGGCFSPYENFGRVGDRLDIDPDRRASGIGFRVIHKK